MNERIAFVTGGAGFIGGRLLRRLHSEGWAVRALVRSDASARVVEALGATPVRGNLSDIEKMRVAADGCWVAFHLAAMIGDFEPAAEFHAANVVGTANAVRACQGAGVRRFVNVSSYVVAMADRPLHRVDARAPLRLDSPVPYNVSKALAEMVVQAASHSGFETISIRPSLTWGLGDRHLLPEIVELVRANRFTWLDGGRRRVATSHVDNVVEALVLASERGVPGRSYFVTDGEDPTAREFFAALLEAEGERVPWGSVPTAAVLPAARLVQWMWGWARPGRRPPLTLAGCLLLGLEVTVDDSRARAELSYAPVRSRQEGLREMSEAREGVALRRDGDIPVAGGGSLAAA
ncbi:MAG: NAD-dependent epimerase/dehydratase family protein [Actinomycetota bacterium]|nr:NAD-dependent epimerase/dehydratase family protein [Actinomycetota bacterium]